MSLHILNPKIFGTHREKVNKMQRMTDFVRDILNESIAVDITASKRPIIDVNAAINTKKKNNQIFHTTKIYKKNTIQLFLVNKQNKKTFSYVEIQIKDI